MPFKRLPHRFSIAERIFLALICLGSFIGCRPVAQETPAELESAFTATPLPTETPTPEATPTPLPNLVILYTPEGADPGLVQMLNLKLTELAGRDGLRFETRAQLVEADLEQEPRLVVVLPPDPGVIEMAQNHPQVQFLAVELPDLEPAENLSILRAGGDAPDQQAFLAGYIATVLTPDWRVGIISRGDTIPGRAARNGFINGVIFYCGLCRPVYPPFYTYPLYYDLSGGASTEEQIAAADFMITQAVQTVYVAPETGDEALLAYLAQAGVNLIGSQVPPEEVKPNWIATISSEFEATIEDVWYRIMNGEGGMVIKLPLTVGDQNVALFSPGRQRHVNRILQDMVSGYIDTGIDPATGELQ